jgi:hypothetical protein
MGLLAGRLVRTGAVLEQVPVQEVEFCGDDRLVLVEEGGVMPSVDLQDFRSGCHRRISSLPTSSIHR